MSDNDRLPLLPYSKLKKTNKKHGKVKKPKRNGTECKVRGADEQERQPRNVFYFSNCVFFIAKYFKKGKKNTNFLNTI